MEKTLLIYNQIIYPKLVLTLFVIFFVLGAYQAYLYEKFTRYLHEHYPEKWPWGGWERIDLLKFNELLKKYPDWYECCFSR